MISAVIRMSAVLTSLLTGILVGGCDRRESVPDMIPAELRRLERADPARDLSEAMKQNDLRFLEVGGYSRDAVPGVPDFEERYKRVGTKVIPGTGDVFLNAEHERLQQVAHDYAKRYNTLLLEHVKKKGIAGPR
jgi:hypothetical protein